MPGSQSMGVPENGLPKNHNQIFQLRNVNRDHTLTRHKTTLSLKKLPLYTQMEWKSAPGFNASDFETSDSILTDPRESNLNAFDSSVTETPVSAPKALDSSTPYLTPGLVKAQPRRPQWIQRLKERPRRKRAIAQVVTRKLSDEQLREILQKPSEERDESGNITNMDYIFQFVPREYGGSPVEDHLAVLVLRTATENAVYDRLSPIPSIKSYRTNVTQDRYRRITAY